MKKKFYIVLNAAKSEGYITDDESDAKQAMGELNPQNFQSALADHFIECYGDDETHKFEIELELN